MALLHASSSHPNNLIRNIPVSQFLRVKRIFSLDFEKQAQGLFRRFGSWGYKKLRIQAGYHSVKGSAQNQLLAENLVRSHYQSKSPENIFRSKSPKWGCQPCGKCLACSNIDSSTQFSDSRGSRDFHVTHTISCNTSGVIYHATCPCGLI